MAMVLKGEGVCGAPPAQMKCGCHGIAYTTYADKCTIFCENNAIASDVMPVAVPERMCKTSHVYAGFFCLMQS